MTGPVHLPPDVDGEALLGPLFEVTRHRGEWVPQYQVDGAYRRLITEQRPELFALVYLSRLLRSRETCGLTSLADHHVDIARVMTQWIPSPARVRAPRDAVISARGSAKSTWASVVGPTWALAHGHRRFALAFGDSTEQIRLHLATFRNQLAVNPWLIADFPDLQPWAGARGRQDTATTYVARSGATYAVRGMTARVLGAKGVDGDRPDVLIADDIEPGEADYTARARAKRLDTWRHDVLPMNEQAAVMMVGTTTGGYGSIMHALVRAAVGEQAEEWIAETGLRVRYYPAIVDGPAGPASFWPQRFSLAWLRSISRTRDYALNYLCRPPAPGGTHWREDTFTYRESAVRHLALFIDPAPTSGPTSDPSAFVIGGLTEDGRVAILYARAFRLTGTGIRTHARNLCRQNPRIRTVRMEHNVAGDWAHDVLEPWDQDRPGERVALAPGVRVETFRSYGHKGSVDRDGRITVLFDEYSRDLVEHAERLPELEEQAKRWGSPGAGHDDIVDITAALVDQLLHPQRHR